MCLRLTWSTQLLQGLHRKALSKTKQVWSTEQEENSQVYTEKPCLEKTNKNNAKGGQGGPAGKGAC